MRDSGIKREEIFVSEWTNEEETEGGRRKERFELTAFRLVLVWILASKIVSKNHGYESTLKGVEESLEKMGLGESVFRISARMRMKGGRADPSVELAVARADYIDLFLIHDPVSSIQTIPLCAFCKEKEG